jgi:hypothetical protein
LRPLASRAPRGLRVSGHLAPFARLWTAFPSSLVGRYPHDYYEACVTMERLAGTR